jgi:hypothetical protein
MTTTFSLTHDFSTIPLDIFEAYLNHPKLNERLVSALGFDERKLITKEASNNETSWVFLVKKSASIPSPLKKFLTDGSLSWQETSRFIPDEHCIYWHITPTSNLIKFHGDGVFRLSKKNKGCSRVIEGSITVDIPLVGKMIEKIIVQELVKQYEFEQLVQCQFYDEITSHL